MRRTGWCGPVLGLAVLALPEPIAERLKTEPGVIAEHYDAVSVPFADIVKLLDQVFSAFDRWWPA